MELQNCQQEIQLVGARPIVEFADGHRVKFELIPGPDASILSFSQLPCSSLPLTRRGWAARLPKKEMTLPHGIEDAAV